MEISPIKTRIFRERENLINFIAEYVKKLPEKSILVITSKIISLAEGKTAEFKSRKDKERLIKKESDLAIKTKYTWLTIKNRTVMTASGIDESNADNKLILLPQDAFKTAAFARDELKKIYQIKNLGVLITDSRLMPLRAGAVGIALGYAGFGGIRDYRSKLDIFGRKLQVTRTDVADSLATAAVLTMGEGAERQPLAIIKDASVEFSARINRQELEIDPREDVYQPLFEKIKKYLPAPPR